MKQNNLVAVAIVVGLSIPQSLIAQLRYPGELKVVTNPPTTVEIKVEAIGVVWGSMNAGYPVTHEYDLYDTTSTGFYADNVDNCCASNPPHILGYGKYKITITKGGQDYEAFADYRDCDYQVHQDYFIANGDIEFTFDCINNRFNGNSDVQIWDAAHKYDVYPRVTNCFTIPATIQNSFSGGRVSIDGNEEDSPYNADWSLSRSYAISAPSPQVVGIQHYAWYSWSDGGARTHSVLIDGSFSALGLTADFLGAWISGESEVYHAAKKSYPPNCYIWSASASNGVTPYTYAWFKDDLQVGTNPSVQLCFPFRWQSGSYQFTLKVDVEDANGALASASRLVTAYYGVGDPHVIAFDQAGGALPDGFEVVQNYPNPFNPETEIPFALPEPSSVRIIVSDMLGREIMTLVDRDYSAGYQRVTWNGTDGTGKKVGSGVYFWRIIATGQSGKQFVKVMKMALTK